ASRPVAEQSRTIPPRSTERTTEQAQSSTLESTTGAIASLRPLPAVVTLLWHYVVVMATRCAADRTWVVAPIIDGAFGQVSRTIVTINRRDDMMPRREPTR